MHEMKAFKTYFLSIRLTISSHNKLFFLRRSISDCVCGFEACLKQCPLLNAVNWSPIHDKVSLAPYMGSPWDNIDTMLDAAGFKSGDQLLDLGAGDGRVLIRAVLRGASKATGIELSKEVHELGKSHINFAFQNHPDLHSRIQFLHENALDFASNSSNLLRFDVITLFLLPQGLKLIEPLLATAKATKDNSLGSNSKSTSIVTQCWPLESETLNCSKKITTFGGSEIFLYDL